MIAEGVFWRAVFSRETNLESIEPLNISDSRDPVSADLAMRVKDVKPGPSWKKGPRELDFLRNQQTATRSLCSENPQTSSNHNSLSFWDVNINIPVINPQLY